MYWFRNGDGSCSYGTVCLGRPNDPSEYLIKFPDKIKKRKADVINNIDFSQYTRDDVYMFLYGYTEKEIISLVNTRQQKMPELKQWDSDTVHDIDVNLFLVTFLVFIDSQLDFNSKLWETIKIIYWLIVEQNEIVFENADSFNDYVQLDFFIWFYDFVSNELANKVLQYLNEEQCYWCYTSLCEVKKVILPEDYDKIEQKCCNFFDKIALKRIDSKISIPKNLDELFTYSIDTLFFYEDYFKLQQANPETKEHVNDVATLLYIEIAKMLIKHKYYLQAQNFLDDAEERYVKKSQLTEIIEIEYSIKRPVERLLRKQKAKDARTEKKKQADRLKNIKKLYRCIRKSMRKILLPQKTKQLDRIMKSMLVLLGHKTDYIDYSLGYQRDVFTIYADAAIYLFLNPKNRRSYISVLKNKYLAVLKDDAQVANVVAFASLNSKDHQFEIVTDEDLSFVEEIGKELLGIETHKKEIIKKEIIKKEIIKKEIIKKEIIKKEIIKKEIIIDKHDSKDLEYGLVVTNPIYTTGVQATNAYLEHLVSFSGQRYKWELVGAIPVKEFGCMVNLYQGILPSGQKSPIIYINMHGSEDSHSAPIGFMYVD